MLKKNYASERKVSIIFTGALALLAPLLSIADDSVTDELRHCASVDDAATRLACYDELGGRRDSNPVPVAAPVAASESVALPPDELGSESLHATDRKKDAVAAVIAKVNSCEKNAHKKYVFYLDGGQVWKQVSDKRLYFKECNFKVSIRKDFFGYKMQQEGSKTKFRVSRLR